MKKAISFIISLSIILITILNMNKITDYVVEFLDDEKRATIQKSNDYTKNYDFKFVKLSDDYIPYSYQDLLNIIYSTLNNGWETFTFYCPDEYTNCLKDVNKISKDSTLLSNINNFVHPFNNYTKLGIVSSNTGEVTLNVDKLYSDEDIKRIEKGVDEIITTKLTIDMENKDKILTIHDFIINTTKYDIDKKYDESYTALGPLFNGTAVCSGYADLMAIFITKIGLKNYKVASDTHVWNVVLIDGEWLHLDLTWDDPVTKDSDVNTLSHKFFMIDNKKLSEYDTEDHKFDTTIYQELN